MSPGGDACPYREHALHSEAEHQAFAAVTACARQLRLAPSGRVIGLDLGAVLATARARGGDLAVLSELFEAAEAGVLEALRASDEG